MSELNGEQTSSMENTPIQPDLIFHVDFCGSVVVVCFNAVL